jgi:hypothetical protein
MTSSSVLAEEVTDDVLERARALCPSAVRRIVRAGSGGNSRLYRVDCADGTYALKSYPSRAQDRRDRLGVEFQALSFMHRHGVTDVPRALAADAQAGLGLYEWIDGDVLSNPGPADADAATDFLARLHALRDAEHARALPLASEACLSGAEVVAQIDRRLVRLREVAAAGDGDAELAGFLRDRFAPAFADLTALAAEGYRHLGRSFDAPLELVARSLCPSDFGFHNALRRPDGKTVYIDFEYFGWDDPVKLTADLLFHPGTRVEPAIKRRLVAASRAIHRDDPAFFGRLELLYPLIGLRWCMILLNEFLPERWAHRVHADGARDWPQVKRRQLERSQTLLDAIYNSRSRFPYGE